MDLVVTSNLLSGARDRLLDAGLRRKLRGSRQFEQGLRNLTLST